MSDSFQRLASGQRINNASDDPAGLEVSTSLRANVRLFTQAIRNVNDGISLLNVAEGALNQLSAISMRHLELAEQAASGTFSQAQRHSMTLEANALVDEFNRIVDTVGFNGKTVLDGSIETLSLQVDAGGDAAKGNSISFQMVQELQRTTGDATFQEGATYFGGDRPTFVTGADLNSDGIIDLVTTSFTDGRINVFLGKGDGTFDTGLSYVGGAGAYGVSVGDFNSDGKLDVASAALTDDKVFVLMGAGDGTFGSAESYDARGSGGEDDGPIYISSADFNGDNVLDLATATGNCATILLGNHDGSFKAGVSYASGNDNYTAVVADLNADGINDIVMGSPSDDEMNVLIGNGDGTFKAAASYYGGDGVKGVAAADFNMDGIIDLASAAWNSLEVLIHLGNGDGTFKKGTSYEAAGLAPRLIAAADYNGDGIADLAVGSVAGLNVLVGNGDGSFTHYTSYSTSEGSEVFAGDLNGDGVLDLASTGAGIDQLGIFLANTIHTSKIAYMDLFSSTSASAHMGEIQSTRDRVTAELGSVMAMERRLSHVTNNLFSKRGQTAAADSRITDVDVAEETSNLVPSWWGAPPALRRGGESGGGHLMRPKWWRFFLMTSGAYARPVQAPGVLIPIKQQATKSSDTVSRNQKKESLCRILVNICLTEV